MFPVPQANPRCAIFLYDPMPHVLCLVTSGLHVWRLGSLALTVDPMQLERTYQKKDI